MVIVYVAFLGGIGYRRFKIAHFSAKKSQAQGSEWNELAHNISQQNTAVSDNYSNFIVSVQTF